MHLISSNLIIFPLFLRRLSPGASVNISNSGANGGAVALNLTSIIDWRQIDLVFETSADVKYFLKVLLMMCSQRHHDDQINETEINIRNYSKKMNFDISDSFSVDTNMNSLSTVSMESEHTYKSYCLKADVALSAPPDVIDCSDADSANSTDGVDRSNIMNINSDVDERTGPALDPPLQDTTSNLKLSSAGVSYPLSLKPPRRRLIVDSDDEADN